VLTCEWTTEPYHPLTHDDLVERLLLALELSVKKPIRTCGRSLLEFRVQEVGARHPGAAEFGSIGFWAASKAFRLE
jgi:hypothetical protein